MIAPLIIYIALGLYVRLGRTALQCRVLLQYRDPDAQQKQVHQRGRQESSAGDDLTYRTLGYVGRQTTTACAP